MLLEEGGKALAHYLKPRETGEASMAMPDEMSEMSKTLTKVAESWIASPERAVKAQVDLWNSYVDVWNNTVKASIGADVKPVIEPERSDRRFQDPEWENPVFSFLKQSYLVTEHWAKAMVEEATDIDDHTRHKADFYITQLSNAIAPTNFFLTNPAILRETLKSNGENLVRGMHMLAEDIQTGEGELKVRMSDNEKFAVGENIAMTPGKVIYENELMQLIQYEPTTRNALAKPLLIVPPWINKFYILDLAPGKSFIEWAVSEGLTVFTISWVNPDERHAEKSFEDYMKDGILEAVRVALEITREDDLNIIGYCVGGTLLACTLAYMAAKGDDRIQSATFLTTQVDFKHAGDLKVFVDEEQLSVLEEQMKERGYLEGKKMANAFNMLRSNDLIWPYIINNYMLGKQPFPFDLLYWNSDSTRMPAANHSFYLRNCYLENKLSQGQVVIDNTRLDLSRVEIPIYNLATREDHIAPAKSVFLGSAFFGDNVRFVLAGSGHIAGVINPPAKNKYQYWTGGPAVGELEDWFQDAEETPGSWWPDWVDWIRSHSDREVTARKPGSTRKYKAIEDAPGSYVKVKA
ncbi:MAG: class I poly(R)-hydroxyalkanoic acid synthase [Pseudomonadota bacterium]